MKKLLLNTFFFLSILFSLTLVACSGSAENDEQQQTTDSLINEEITDSLAQNFVYEDGVVYTKYNLPLPVDLFLSLKETNSTFNSEILNAPQNAGLYNTSIIKAVNFGIYAADLAYCNIFEKNQDAIIYFHVTKQLADELNIDKGYDESIIERLEANIANSDSLNKIATKSYWDACNYLEKNDNINILPFIVSGGWVETMYLAINSNDSNEKMMQKVASQKTSLENLMKYLYDVMMDSNTFIVNEDVQDLGFKFAELKKIYDQLETSGDKILITEAQFKLIASEIEKIRNIYSK